MFYIIQRADISNEIKLLFYLGPFLLLLYGND